MTPDFDLVIVGGSFAGLVCARTAAIRGLRVAVIDRKRDPGSQIRTTGVLVKEAADVLDLPSGVSRKVRGVRVYAPSGRHRDLDSDGYYFLATDTAALLRWLAVDAAMAAGARLLYGTRWQGACCLRLRGIDITTRYLIGADGARSQVAVVSGWGSTPVCWPAAKFMSPVWPAWIPAPALFFRAKRGSGIHRLGGARCRLYPDRNRQPLG